MAEPVVKVEIAFDSPAFSASPTWVDVTDWVRAIDTGRGRNMENADFEAGIMTVTLDNADGRFTPRVTPRGGEPQLKPRRNVRVTATYASVTYPLGYGVIERWPATVGDSDVMVSVQATDAFSVLTSTTFPESDTGALTKLKPINYWPLQETSIAPVWPFLDVVGGRNGFIFWSGSDGRPAGAPVAVAGASSNLPSGAGNALDLRGYYQDTASGNYGANAFACNPVFAFGSGVPFTATMQCIIPALTRGDGTYPVLLSTASASTAITRDIIIVKSDGTVNVLGKDITPAGAFNTYTNYRVTVSFQRLSVGPTINRVILTLNGDQWTLDSSAFLFDPSGDYLTFGGRGNTDGGGTGGRWSHLALWDRALTAAECSTLWSDNLCAPGLTASTRINRALDIVGWPAAARAIQAGVSTLVRDSWSDNTSLLTLFRKWAQADGGDIYIGPDGAINFKNRYSRISGPFTPVATFDCLSDTGVEAGLEWVMDEADIVNVVNLNVSYGLKTQIRNEASVAEFGEKARDLALDVQSSAAGLDAADYMLARYAQPTIRLSTVVLNPAAVAAGSLWVAALSVDIGKVVRLTNLPVTAPGTTLDYMVESVRHSIVRDGANLLWSTRFDVSPLPLTAWVLNDTTNSVLGSTTRLAY